MPYFLVPHSLVPYSLAPYGLDVRLTRTTTAVQAAGLAVGGVDRAADKPQRIIEAGDQLRRDHVLGEGLLWLGDTFGEVEDEVPFADPFGQVENL